jgi:hypothetical protein
MKENQNISTIIITTDGLLLFIVQVWKEVSREKEVNFQIIL